MEEPLDRVLSGLIQKDTTGAMVIDGNGLVLGLSGPSACEKCSGSAKLLVDRAKALGDAGQTPSVCIETEGGSILLEQEQHSPNNTVVLYKKKEGQ